MPRVEKKFKIKDSKHSKQIQSHEIAHNRFKLQAHCHLLLNPHSDYRKHLVKQD